MDILLWSIQGHIDSYGVSLHTTQYSYSVQEACLVDVLS